MPNTKSTKSLLAVLLPVVALLAQPQAEARLPTHALQEALAAPAAEGCAGLAELRTLDTRKALIELYRNHGFVPLWQGPRLFALQQELAQLGDDGLIPADYSHALTTTHPAGACEDLQLSSEYLLALEHLSQGRLDPRGIEPRWVSPTAEPRPALDLVAVAQRGLRDMQAAFDEARPALPLYRELRAAYARMDHSPEPWQLIPQGPTLKPGASDARLALLAQRLHQQGFLVQSWPAAGTAALPLRYDADLERAVKAFQARHGLQVDGLVGKETLAALNVTPAERLLQVRINLERLRWMNAHKAENALVVNVAGGDIRLYRGDAVVWRSRVQTGQPARPTPLLVSRIDRLTLNPGWTVPPTILEEDLLPKIRADAGYLAEHDMQVLDLQGRPLPAEQINWNGTPGILLRQAPGPRNPLGALVFRLNNPFSIYLHDTPSQQLFERAARAVSSGCVRVEDADGLADELLAGRTMEERREIAALRADGATHEVSLPEGPELILTYWTAEAASDGSVKFLRDPYGLDRALMKAMR